MRQICLYLVSRNLQEFCLLGEFRLFTTCVLNVFSQFWKIQKICQSLWSVVLFLASNFAFIRGFPVKSPLCMQHISERQIQPLKSHGLRRSHMLYASSGVNNLQCLLELAKWVQLVPAAGPDRQCGDSEEMQSQR